jgi:hypothetical protein
MRLPVVCRRRTCGGWRRGGDTRGRTPHVLLCPDGRRGCSRSFDPDTAGCWRWICTPGANAIRNCEYCGETKEDVKHLFSCKKTEKERVETLGCREPPLTVLCARQWEVKAYLERIGKMEGPTVVAVAVGPASAAVA